MSFLKRGYKSKLTFYVLVFFFLQIKIVKFKSNKLLLLLLLLALTVNISYSYNYIRYYGKYLTFYQFLKCSFNYIAMSNRNKQDFEKL